MVTRRRSKLASIATSLAAAVVVHPAASLSVSRGCVFTVCGAVCEVARSRTSAAVTTLPALAEYRSMRDRGGARRRWRATRHEPRGGGRGAPHPALGTVSIAGSESSSITASRLAHTLYTASAREEKCERTGGRGEVSQASQGLTELKTASLSHTPTHPPTQCRGRGHSGVPSRLRGENHQKSLVKLGRDCGRGREHRHFERKKT